MNMNLPADAVSKTSTGGAILRVMRPHQWVKNILVFLPVLLAHNFSADAWWDVALAFCSFSLGASAMYVINDIIDIEADRQHPTKRNRPFAAGALATSWGLPLVVTLLLGAIAIAFAVSWEFLGVLVVYLVATSLYSGYLKRKVMIDVLTLAGLYSLRIIAGGIATETVVSDWLAAFSFFFFTSLAFAKRFVELSGLPRDQKGAVPNRGYVASDLSLLETLGPTSGYLSVLVLALYLNSDAVHASYQRTWPLLLLCPLLMYWISRLWIHAKRCKLADDPILFAFRDRVSLIVGGLTVFLWCLASLPFPRP